MKYVIVAILLSGLLFLSSPIQNINILATPDGEEFCSMEEATMPGNTCVKEGGGGGTDHPNCWPPSEWIEGEGCVILGDEIIVNACNPGEVLDAFGNCVLIMEEEEVLTCQPPEIMDISSGNCYDPSEFDEPKRWTPGEDCDVSDPSCSDPCWNNPNCESVTFPEEESDAICAEAPNPAEIEECKDWCWAQGAAGAYICGVKVKDPRGKGLCSLGVSAQTYLCNKSCDDIEIRSCNGDPAIDYWLQ